MRSWNYPKREQASVQVSYSSFSINLEYLHYDVETAILEHEIEID